MVGHDVLHKLMSCVAHVFTHGVDSVGHFDRWVNDRYVVRGEVDADHTNSLGLCVGIVASQFGVHVFVGRQANHGLPCVLLRKANLATGRSQTGTVSTLRRCVGHGRHFRCIHVSHFIEYHGDVLVCTDDSPPRIASCAFLASEDHLVGIADTVQRRAPHRSLTLAR